MMIARRGIALLSLSMGFALAGGPLGAQSIPEPPSRRLGKTLFFDARLSADGKVSCATCHSPDTEFADLRAVSVGAFNRTGTRNAPSLLARQHWDPLFWDGRRDRLESQVLDPFTNPVEHGLKDQAELLGKLRGLEEYRPLFLEAFNTLLEDVHEGQIAAALAEFVSSIPRAATAVERFLRGEEAALSANEQRGLAIFRERAKCATCHIVSDRFAGSSDGRYHSVGIGFDSNVAAAARKGHELVRQRGLDHLVLLDPKIAALGRFLVTGDPRDIGKFRTPGLRRVSKTAPYMHDGSVRTLEQALDRELYYRSLESGSPLTLTPDERADLLKFLEAL
jgi:cytochrome c peroxidase